MTVRPYSLAAEMQCVILAGGLGTRMSRFTSTVPKALIPVDGVPFLRIKLQSLASQGILDVVVSTGHLGDQIEHEVAHNTAPGMTVRCVPDGPTLLGTAGALRRIADRKLLAEKFLLTYGDSYLLCDHRAVAESFDETRFDALMTLWPVEDSDETPNATLRGDTVVRYDKGHHSPDMEWVDYGLLVVTRRVVTDMIPPDTAYDLATVCSSLAASGRLQGVEVPDKYFEIGSESGLAELEAHLARKDQR